MTIRDVANIYNVQTGIHIRRHLSPEKIHHDFPGWSWLPIVVADRSRRIHDHNGKALLSKFQCRPFGQELRALVWALHVPFRDWRPLISDSTGRHPYASHSAGV